MGKKNKKNKKKPEDFGRFSRRLLKKKYGDEYQVITQKDRKDLKGGQKDLFDQTVKSFEKDIKKSGEFASNKLLVIGKKNKPVMGIPPSYKFSNLEEIDYRSSNMQPSNKMLLSGDAQYRGRKSDKEALEESRSRVGADIDFDGVEKGKVSASYSGSNEGVNPKTGLPITKSNPRMRIIKYLKHMSNSPDVIANKEVYKQDLKYMQKKVLGKAKGGYIHVKSKLGKTKPTKLY